MAQPELDRQVRQHGNDIDSLYELTATIDGKVDANTATLAEHGQQLSEIRAEQANQAGQLSDMQQTLNAILTRLDER